MTDVVLKNIDRKDGDFTIPESTYINVYLAGFLNRLIQGIYGRKNRLKHEEMK